MLYAGFPMSMRQGRWIAGFAVRPRDGAVVLYLSTAAARAIMPPAARRVGRGGFSIHPNGRLTTAQIVALARRAFTAAKRDGADGRVIDGHHHRASAAPVRRPHQPATPKRGTRGRATRTAVTRAPAAPRRTRARPGRG